MEPSTTETEPTEPSTSLYGLGAGNPGPSAGNCWKGSCQSVVCNCSSGRFPSHSHRLPHLSRHLALRSKLAR
eukprot:15465660-Alexandrium_andersonii.AAC.1